jgi:hypothetical protein
MILHISTRNLSTKLRHLRGIVGIHCVALCVVFFVQLAETEKTLLKKWSDPEFCQRRNLILQDSKHYLVS